LNEPQRQITPFEMQYKKSRATFLKRTAFKRGGTVLHPKTTIPYGSRESAYLRNPIEQQSFILN
jgi:hypothetical protein